MFSISFLTSHNILTGGMWVMMLLSNFHHRVIRLTAPLLNYAIVCGAFLMYVSVFFGVLPTVQKALIHMQCIVSQKNLSETCILYMGTKT